MARPVRSIAALAGSVGLAALGVALPGSADAADATPAVTIDSVTSDHDAPGAENPGRTVTGTADVTFTVHAADSGPEPYAAVVSVSGYGAGTGEVSRRIDLAPGDCLPSCTLHAALDTAATKPFPGAESIAAPLVQDGANDIRVEVLTARPSITAATADITVDNHRPTVTLPDLPGDDAWTDSKPVGLTADRELKVRAVAQDGGGGVSHVEFFSDHPAWPAPTDLTDEGDGTWTGAVDTSKIYSTLWTSQYVVAFDEEGRAGVPVRAAVLVDHGFTVTPVVDPVTHSLPSVVTLNYKYPGSLAQPFPRNLNYAYPVSTRVLLDDQLLATSRVADFTYEGYPDRLYASLGDNAVPYGKHTLTFDVTDNRGAHGTARTSVNVVSGVDASWVSGFGEFPVAGKTWKVEATTTADDGVSRAQTWTMTVDGKTISTGSYPARPSGTWKADTPGLHEFALTTVSQFGDTSVTTQPLRVLAATTTKLGGPALTTYGAKQALTATVTQTGGKPAAGAAVSLQFRPQGSTTWSTVAKAATDSRGTAHFTTTAKRSGTWRAVTAAKNLTWTTSTSATVTGKVKATLTVKSPTTAVHHGKTVTYHVTSTPYVAGTKIYLQVREIDGTWTTGPAAKLNADGTAVFTQTFPRVGTGSLRVYRPAGTTLTASYSTAWTVHVS
ncbi:hypothetical protein ACFYXJ_12505 [Streptomyces sp. NPDC002667]|uniref:hypothetical protein n=1 Tax=Streptomyces sp. NPDC002667 TaxID=3364657 RepID=UPI0036AC88B0